MKPRLNPLVFRRAAELVASGEEFACCYAIGSATAEMGISYSYGYYEDLLTHYLKEPDQFFAYWWPREEVDARVIALLLCEILAREEAE